MHEFIRTTQVAPVAMLNRSGVGALVLVCEHASNYIPPEYARLGLPASELQRHIAWDIGALGMAEHLSTLLDAPLVFATHSRLLRDLNRAATATDSIVTQSENTIIPGNLEISAAERLWRDEWLYEPFHAAIDALIDERLAKGLPTAVASIHSYTPEYLGQARPWHIGVISREDRRLADRILHAMRQDTALCVGDNEPYAPAHGVYHSIERHAEARGLPGVMIEVRNDLIDQRLGQLQWAGRLARDFRAALDEVFNRAGPSARRVVTETGNQ